MKVESDEEAIALMNDSEFGLTASLWTADAERAAAIGARIETGTVSVGDQPGVVEISPDGATAVVGNTKDADLSIIDAVVDQIGPLYTQDE